MSTTESTFSLLGSEVDTDETRPMSKQKIVVVGAGPVGALAAIYAAQRGHDVEIYELRNDLRDPSTTPLNFTKSINLALSERGINAIRHSGRRDLLDKIMEETIPMRGRMIHGKRSSGEFFEEPQDYDIHGRTNFAVDRGVLNKRLLDALEALPNVKFFFSHKLVGADFKEKKAWFEAKSQQNTEELEVNFDLLIGADGAHSAARYHLMKYTRMDYRQEYVDTLWCEFTIERKADFQKDLPNSKFRISPNHLHIWPGKEHMFIAIPNIDGSFTCTLFMPAAEFTHLETNHSQIHPFFEKYFPGVTLFIKPEDLVGQFKSNPHLPLISINCQPYHYGSSAVIVGDAAHAMVPFYGQGMNAGLESVRILFSQLDAHPSDRAAALAEYSRFRAPDAAAINELALQNYIEMRASVTSPLYKLRKWLEESLSVYVPSLGWATKYSRVSFGNERYSEVVRKAEHQGKVIRWALGTVTAVPFVGLGLWAVWKWRNVFGTPVRR